MARTLSENIRVLRRARHLTQEQLAQALCVTVGAVYKWEADLSQPELTTLMELADFFDTTVDALLGYVPRDNRLPALAARLTQYRHQKNRAGLAEAEKALHKYPNTFEIVYPCAALYRVFGIATGERPLLYRAMELLQTAARLLPQNTDPKIGEHTLSAEMAEVLLSLGECEQAVSLLKQADRGGAYDDRIGLMLAAECGRPEEAMPYLSAALLETTAALLRILMGYANVYFSRQDFRSAQALLQWGLTAISGLKDGQTPCFLDKIGASLTVWLAFAHLQNGENDAARAALKRARSLASAFDAAPNFRAGSLRFIRDDEQAGVYDDLGETALGGVEKTLRDLESPALSAMWREENEHE